MAPRIKNGENIYFGAWYDLRACVICSARPFDGVWRSMWYIAKKHIAKKQTAEQPDERLHNRHIDTGVQYTQ